MRVEKGEALAGRTAQRFGGEQQRQALENQYSSEDAFRIAYVRAHVIGCYRKGPDRKRAILRFLQALKAALATEARP